MSRAFVSKVAPVDMQKFFRRMWALQTPPSEGQLRKFQPRLMNLIVLGRIPAVAWLLAPVSPLLT